MMNLYEKFLQDKAAGHLPKWKSLTRDQLFDLYCNSEIVDAVVADLFDISIAMVRYARTKHGISHRLISVYKFLNSEERLAIREYDELAKSKLLSDDNADALAIGLTHCFFRNGPVESMHAKGQLSENDMMVLNKHMVNQIATILFLLKKKRWLELECLLKFDMRCGSNWDKPFIDLFSIYKLVEIILGP